MDKYRLSLIVISLLAVGILFGGFFLGVQPQLDRMARAGAEATSIRFTNDVQQKKNEALAADSENLPQYTKELAAERTRIPAARAQQELIDQLDAAATAAGVTVTSLTFEPVAAYAAPADIEVPVPASGELVGVPMRVTVAGDRTKLETFAARLQSSPRIVSVEESSFTGGGDTSLVLSGRTWVLLP